MKRTLKLLGIIAVIALVGFSALSCKQETAEATYTAYLLFPNTSDLPGGTNESIINSTFGISTPTVGTGVYPEGDKNVLKNKCKSLPGIEEYTGVKWSDIKGALEEVGAPPSAISEVQSTLNSKGYYVQVWRATTTPLVYDVTAVFKD